MSSERRVFARQEISRLTKKITNHPAQIIFLKEIRSQLEMYQSILTKENNQDIHVKVSDIEKIYKIITSVLDEKKSIDQSSEMMTLQTDTVFTLISYVSKKNTAKTNP